ncbi:MAG: trypsin-like peptidase domain-containing protein [Bernardetiaceae bacterium]|nr:trypsin-like peptidase domain-containing protein [Bernardetiaceae bacterium]
MATLRPLRRIWQRVTPVVVWLGLLQCSGIIRHDVPLAAYQQLAKQPGFACVGKVRLGLANHGSCVLVGPRHVLTAAHLLYITHYQTDTSQLQGRRVVQSRAVGYQPIALAQLRIYFKLAGQSGPKGFSRLARRAVVHPDIKPGQPNSPADLALVELDTPMADVFPAPLNRLPNELGYPVVGVGYGRVGRADRPGVWFKASRAKLAGQNVVDSLGGSLVNGLPSLLVCDFDQPGQPANNRLGSPVPQPLEYLSASGDSGGGLFRQQAGGWQLVGILRGAPIDPSRLLTTGYYGQMMKWTRLAAFAPWVRQQMAEANQASFAK